MNSQSNNAKTNLNRIESALDSYRRRILGFFKISDGQLKDGFIPSTYEIVGIEASALTEIAKDILAYLDVHGAKEFVDMPESCMSSIINVAQNPQWFIQSAYNQQVNNLVQVLGGGKAGKSLNAAYISTANSLLSDIARINSWRKEIQTDGNPNSDTINEQVTNAEDDHASKSGLNMPNISVLKKRLKEGIKILSDKFTIKTLDEHPLFISCRERGHRYSILDNSHMKGSCISQFHLKAYTLAELEKLFREINEWGDKCVSDLNAIYDNNYCYRFKNLRILNGVVENQKDKDSLAGIQIRLKTQLENMIEYLLRRIAFNEEFGKYDKIIAIELMIDQYTRKLFELLLTIGNYDRAAFYPDYFDPLSFFIIPKIKEQLQKKPKAEVDFLIDEAKMIICGLSRKDFDFNSSIPHSDQEAENINSRIRIAKEDFEREWGQLIADKLPNNFISIWEKEVNGYRGFTRIIDLMEALNRLPIYMRDELSNSSQIMGYSGVGPKDTYLMVPFPTPQGAKWTDVYISIYNKEFANIHVGEVIKKNIHYRQMGFPAGKVRKHSVSPGQAWRLLVMFARSPDNSLPDRSMRMGTTYSQGKKPAYLNPSMDKDEPYCDPDEDSMEQEFDTEFDTYDSDISIFKVGAGEYLPKTLKVGVSRMRKILRKYFGIKGNPIYEYDKDGRCYKTKFNITISASHNPLD